MAVYPFRFANYDCASLVDNSGRADLEQLFPQIAKKELLAAQRRFDCNTSFEVAYNCLYLRHKDKNVLVDTGTGQGQVLESLAELGLSPEDIELVILTHGDRDHIGGVLNFPNAQFVLSQKMYNAWTKAELQEQMVEEFISLFRKSLSPEDLEARAQGRRDFFLKLLPRIQERLKPVAFEQEFLPGIKLFDATGHRSDHSGVEIMGGGQTLLHVVDSFRHPLQLHYDWASFIDSYPSRLIQSNKQIVKRALQNEALLFGSHLSFPGLVQLRQTNEGLEWHWVRP